MFVVFILFLSVISLGIISSILFLVMLRKSTTRLPKEWRKSESIKNFNLGIYFLLFFLVSAFITYLFSAYLQGHGIQDGFVFSIYFTIATLLLFAFLFIYTQTRWKRYCYIVMYSILVGYLINGGYFHPLSRHTPTAPLLLNSIFFLAALLHLTDLLINPKIDHFKFKLKISLIILIFALMANILTSFHWSDIVVDNVIDFPFIFLLQIGNLILFYFSFACVFILEIIKLYRGSVK